MIQQQALSDEEVTELSELTPSNRAPGWAARLVYGMGILFWLLAFAWLWYGIAPPLVPGAGHVWALRGIGLAWFGLGIFWPSGFIYSLALAFPWFGNNPGGPHHLYLLEMGLMGLVAGDLARRALGAIRPRRNRLDLWVFLFAAYSCLTVIDQFRWILAEYHFYPRGFLYTILNHYGTANVFGLQLGLKLALAVGLYGALRDRPWSPERLYRLWLVLLGALAFTALVGWANYAGLLSLKWWREENQFIEQRFGWPRLQSLYWHAGWLAQYIEALGPGALALALTARRPRMRWLLLGLTGLLLLTQFFTMARAGWIGLAGGLGVVVAAATLADASPQRLRRLAWRLVLLAATLGLLAGVMALLSHDFRNRLGELFAWRHRSGIWKSAVEMCGVHPLTGVGLGYYYTAVRIMFPEGHPYFAADNITAHNLYLHTLAERGLIGLVLFLGLLAVIFRRLLAGLRRAEGEGGLRRGLCLALLGGLAALALDGLFQYIFYVRAIELLFWLLAGVSAALGCDRRPPHGRRAWGVAWAGLAGVLLLLVWMDWEMLVPTQAEVEGRLFHVGPQQVSVPLPHGARRIRLRLASLVPDGEKAPPQDTLLLEGKVLRQVSFSHYAESQAVDLDLPATLPPGAALVIRSSRTWSLWMYGFRLLPYASMGVLYTTPERLE